MPSCTMRLILHIGMHKTASTTIQKRLKANNQLLEKFGYTFIAKNRKALLSAVEQRNFQPWRELLRDAKCQGLTPIVSHEAFSHVLCRSRSNKKTKRIGDWLLKKLRQAGVQVTVIGFVRDQPSYLNSHYTQHVKRFATAKSLEAYAAKAMRPSIGKSSCDPEQLFGWLERQPSVHKLFFPYGRTITPPPALADHPKDPFAQFIHCLGIPPTVQFQAMANLNAQPGDLAIRTALQLSQELKREGIRLGKAAKQARRLICHEAEQRNWMKTPYMGLNPKLNERIRSHYAAANNRFSIRVWGCPWDQIFTVGSVAESRIPTTAEQEAVNQAVKQIRLQLGSRPQRFRPLLRFLADAAGRTKERC